MAVLFLESHEWNQALHWKIKSSMCLQKSLRMLSWNYTRMHTLIKACSSHIKLSEKAVFPVHGQLAFYFFPFSVLAQIISNSEVINISHKQKVPRGKKVNQKYQRMMASKRNYIPEWILHYRQWVASGWAVRRKRKSVLKYARREVDTASIFNYCSSSFCVLTLTQPKFMVL